MSRLRVMLLVAGGLALSACEFPTVSPLIEQRWIVPIEETTISVDELLPEGVSVSGGNFEVDVDELSLNESLGSLCAACAALNLTTAPKPAFNSTFTVTQELPADVELVVISSGSIAVSVTHNLGFDLIQPPGGEVGSLTIVVRNGIGGPSIGTIVVDGTTETFASGATLNVTIDLDPATIGGTIELEVTIDSPAGGTAAIHWVPINTSNVLTATGEISSLLVSSATVNIDGQEVEFDPVEVGLDDLDSEMIARIQRGTLILDIENPFGVAVTGTIAIGPTSKSFTITGGTTSSTSISYTAEELQSFLGQAGIVFSGSGITTGGSIRVEPGQELSIEVTLDFTILIG